MVTLELVNCLKLNRQQVQLVLTQALELDGLEELRLGGVVLGGTGAVIREFSTDPTFAANSNNIVPTKKHRKYVQPKSNPINRDLKVNRLNAGDISFEGDRIPTLVDV